MTNVNDQIFFDNFEKFKTSEFFDFFETHGVSWFYVEGMPRKKCGDRGAPIGSRFGFKFAFHSSKVVDGFRRFDSTMKRKKKSKIDLQTRESPNRRGSRIILLDDLQEHRIDDLMRWWTGPMAIIETSQMNFQALLVSPRFLKDHEVFQCQSAAVSKFETDVGASAVRQLHRFPGSPNFKSGAILNGQPFVCKTLCLIDGEDDGTEQLNELLLSVVVRARKNAKTTSKAVPKNRTSEDGNSERAMAWTLAQLRSGVDHQTILNGLSTVFISHHSLTDWPRRTLHNARHYLGMEPARYRAG